MQFLNPFVLLGLAAAAIPLLLHLLNLRKLKTIDFSTLRFIKELQKTQIRKLKLQQILLLILRTLIIVFAVLAFSRPVIKSTLPVFGGHVKTSAVIILDNSFSMDVSDESGNRLAQSKNVAAQIIRALKDGDEAAILTSADVNEKRKINFSKNFSLLQENIQKISISSTEGQVASLLRMTASLLTETNNINKEVYIVTDAQKNILNAMQDSARLVLNGAAVFTVPIGLTSKVAGQNLSVDSLGILTRIFQINKPVEVEAFIKNNSETDAQGVVVGMSFNGDRVSQRTIDIPAHQVRSINISAPPQKRGLVKAVVEIEGDALETDNKRHFGFVIPPQPRVALVGTPDVTRFTSLVMASDAGRDVASVQEVSPAQFSGTNISDYDMVILTGGISQSDIPRLQNYVRNGGGVLLFADASQDYTTMKSITQGLQLGEPTEATFVPDHPGIFTSTDKLHPIFQGVFKGTTDSKGIVESPKIAKALPVNGGQHIIDMQGGAFLAESRIGEGKVLYCAVPPTITWSNFPFTGLYPTLVFRSVLYATMREALGTDVIAGNNGTIVLPKRYSTNGTFKITDPSNTESLREAAILPSGAVLNLGTLNSTGVYSVLAPNGNVVSTISVNTPARESELTQFDKSAFLESLKAILQENTPIENIDNPRNVTQSVARARIGTELWKLFVILAVVCAIAEMFVARAVKTTE